MSEQNIGLEIDGTRVTVVESLGEVAVSSAVIDVDSLKEAIEIALGSFKRKKKDAPVRISLVGPNTAMRRIDVTPAITESYEKFADTVYNERLPVSRDGSVAAGAFFETENLSTDMVSPGVAVVTLIDTVKDAFAALGLRNVEMTPSAFNLRGHDGVWVGLHYSSVDFALIVDDKPVAFRQSRTGGLNTVLGAIGADTDPELAKNLLENELSGAGTDPTLSAELAKYMKTVSAELEETIEYWRRSGEDIPNSGEVLVHGAGATAPTLQDMLTEHQLNMVVPESITQALTYIPIQDRHTALGAFMASVSVERFMPSGAYPNPILNEQRRARAKRNRVMGLIGASIAGLVGTVYFLGIPLVTAFLEAQSAQRELEQVRGEFERYQEVFYQADDLEIREIIIDTQRAANPNWGDGISTILESAPGGVEITQLSVSKEGKIINAVVTASIPGQGYGTLAVWLDQLRNMPEILEVWSSGFSQQQDSVSTQISLSVNTDPETVVEEEEETENDLENSEENQTP